MQEMTFAILKGKHSGYVFFIIKRLRKSEIRINGVIRIAEIGKPLIEELILSYFIYVRYARLMHYLHGICRYFLLEC